MTSPEPAGETGHPSILDLLQGSPVGEALNTPLPSTPLEALQGSPLAPLLEAPLGEIAARALPELPPLPALPSLPPNPVEALLQGQGLPELPGVDELFKPLTDLAGSFGSGTFGSFDPTSILDMSSGLIDQAMSVSMSGLKALDHIWQSQAAQAAQTQGQQAQASGAELSERGTQISGTTQTAAASVARGNANLMTISESFAATAVAAAPMVMTPPGQAMLLASAAEHIKAAIGVVTQTRTELNEQTLTMNGLAAPVPVPPPPGPAAAAAPPSPFAVAGTVLESVGTPMVSTVTDSLDQLVSATTKAASVSPSDVSAESVVTRSGPAAAAGAAHGVPGSVGIAGGTGIGVYGAGGGTASGSGASVPRTPLVGPVPPGATGAGTPNATGTPGAFGTSTTTGMGTGPGGPLGAMGGGAGMATGRGADEQLTGRTTPGYLVNAGDSNAFVGDLPMVAPAVIGGEDLDNGTIDTRN
ncbi:hypothetical protein [Rhodococcus tibetensis]|uniref:PPE family protein n=1 Tax=Rhodococcus tibetensis TaxID=2965064 RepID=A0ABT1Q8Q7_9NOCA|nr:hypothetical protein [Rhodococcus sp. FXJ9.536]MCQ4118638.1 hypothetical protein [Rhodococcus sp. FXJ9.536]